ncbi:MAG: hypothetical protein WC910_10235 [Bacteroidales bacterium]|jgi:hypothetical protein
MDDIYVLTAEMDGSGRKHTAIVFEQYIEDGKASLKAVKKFQKQVGNRYGKTRIAKLTFIE